MGMDTARRKTTGAEAQPARRAVSFVIRSTEQPGHVLTVLRPPDDLDLPDVWGLPAGSLRPGESWEDAVRRAGREKLGVDLNVGRELARGSLERRAYTLEMRLFEATIASGEPAVPQPHPEVTQYQDLRWQDPSVLYAAADLGSLCCRLFLGLDPANG